MLLTVFQYCALRPLVFLILRRVPKVDAGTLITAREVPERRSNPDLTEL